MLAVLAVKNSHGDLQLVFNGRPIHAIPADHLDFKRVCPPVFDLDVLMYGLGFGVDALYCLNQGAKSVTVIELHPEVIERFRRVNGEVPGLTIVQGNAFAPPVNPVGYDLVLNTIERNEVFCQPQSK